MAAPRKREEKDHKFAYRMAGDLWLAMDEHLTKINKGLPYMEQTSANETLNEAVRIGFTKMGILPK